MDQNIYNMSIRGASSLIDSILISESARTGFGFTVNKYGDLDISIRVLGVPHVTVQVASIERIYDRLVWELLKSIKGCVETFSPRRLSINGFVIATRYQNATLYARELFERTPSWEKFTKHATDCALDTTNVTSSSTFQFIKWVELLFTQSLTRSFAATTEATPDCKYVGLRGNEKFIVVYTGDIYRIFKENGKITTAKSIYDITLYQVSDASARLPVRILHNKIMKEGESSGGVSSSSMVRGGDSEK